MPILYDSVYSLLTEKWLSTDYNLNWQIIDMMTVDNLWQCYNTLYWQTTDSDCLLTCLGRVNRMPSNSCCVSCWSLEMSAFSCRPNTYKYIDDVHRGVTLHTVRWSDSKNNKCQCHELTEQNGNHQDSQLLLFVSGKLWSGNKLLFISTLLIISLKFTEGTSFQIYTLSS